MPENVLRELNAFYMREKDNKTKWRKEKCEVGKEIQMIFKLEKIKLDVGCSACHVAEYDNLKGICTLNRDNIRNLNLAISAELQKLIAYTLWPLAEKWSGAQLHINNVFGIRRYTRGSWLAAHTDKVGKKT